MKNLFLNKNQNSVLKNTDSLKLINKDTDKKDCCGDCKNKGVACKNINFDEIINNHFLTSKI